MTTWHIFELCLITVVFILIVSCFKVWHCDEVLTTSLKANDGNNVASRRV